MIVYFLYICTKANRSAPTYKRLLLFQLDFA
nr:MAG TPA: hypothetical protein [Inoviridae sp.]